MLITVKKIKTCLTEITKSYQNGTERNVHAKQEFIFVPLKHLTATKRDL